MASSIDPTAVFSQLILSYMKLPLIQKIAYPFVIVACISTIIFVSKWANNPDYAVLFSDLEPADSGAVIERLKGLKVNYELRGDGRTIAISPPSMVHELRINLASEGVPKGGNIGFEIFDGNNLGTTSFVEKLKFIRAVQGELERTIGAIDAVSSVRVHITQPEKSVFTKNSLIPTASVMMKLRPGAELEKKQIKGIANLVSGSVEGLKPENVSIVDTNGNLLSNPDDDKTETLAGESTTRIQYQREIEKGYIQRIEQLIGKVIGQGKVIARVTADLDFSMNEREEESYDPGGQVIRSERSIQEGSGASARGGVPGVISNLSNAPNLLSPPESNPNHSSRNENVKNYEVSRAVIKSSNPRGSLKRLSVAVLVDGNYEEAAGEKGADGKPAVQKVFKPLESETLTQIEDLVKGAIGYDGGRGDTVTVENIAFASQEDVILEALDKKASQDLIFNVISKVTPILFIALFFLVVIRPLVKFLITPTEAEMDLQRLLPTGIEELEKELEQERSRATIPIVEESVDLEQLEELMAENSRLVKENPRQAALLIRYWLNDGRI
jgi:flagellar M-ring protein FliF